MTTFATPSIEMEPIPLSNLAKDEQGILVGADLSQDEKDELGAMGLQDDSVFRVCQQGQPCIVQVEATRLGLSVELASKIMVKRCEICTL